MNSVKEVKYFSTGENITKWQNMTLNLCILFQALCIFGYFKLAGYEVNWI